MEVLKIIDIINHASNILLLDLEDERIKNIIKITEKFFKEQILDLNLQNDINKFENLNDDIYIFDFNFNKQVNINELIINPSQIIDEKTHVIQITTEKIKIKDFLINNKFFIKNE